MWRVGVEMGNWSTEFPLLHFSSIREDQLDTPPHFKVIVFLSVSLVLNILISAPRDAHKAWTPPSFPNSIVLLGGWDDAAKLSAEIVPG